MISALNAAASGMEAQQNQIEQIANNLSNVQTTGYKRSRAEFQDLMYETLQEPGANTSALTQSPVGIQRGVGVKVSGTQRNFESGAPLHTQRDMDMMVRGEGFFVVQIPTGEMGFRRDGSFHKSAIGRIETIDGYPIQPEMIIPAGAQRVEISEDGVVNAVMSDTERSQIGQIQLATFVNNGGLKAIGKNLYVATAASGAPNFNQPTQNGTGGIMHHYLEGSNVDVVKEMVGMISAQRAYEMNSKVLQTVDQIMQHTVNVK
ncbi:MAG: flagellar basal-body rod protein FlgG [Deltaproteobacteria bacterium]|nr:flagellar basal-body rod protein FlgG [Deltaproteobacteria bacterium]